MPVQVARSARLNYPLTTYVGDRGQIFWDELQGELRLSDGITPGGFPIQGGTSYLNPQFITNLTALTIADAEDLFLAYDSSTGTLRKISLGDLNLSGETGYTGSQGEVGYTGSQGETGYVGSRGDLGYAGSQGETGYTGSKGLQGLRGYAGSQGVGFVDAIVSGGELVLTYDDSTSINAGRVFGYTGSRGNVGYVGSQGLGFIDANVSQQGELILTYEDSSSVNAGSVVGYTGSAGAPGSAGIADVADNTGLSIENDILSTTYNTTISDTVESVSVGGAQSATAAEWKNKNIVQVLDSILFPDILPTYTIPTLTISGSQTGTKEIGQTISQSLTLTATENDAGVFIDLSIKRGSTILSSDSSPTGTATTDIDDQFGYADPNNPNLRYTLTYVDSFTVVSGTTSWSGTGTYIDGLPKDNNKGIEDERTLAVRSIAAPQAGSTMNSTNVSVSGIYPYFWGVSSTQPSTSSIASEIAAGTANKVLASSTGTVSITFNANAEYVWFAHYSGYTTKTKWYNTELNQGSIGPGNFILSPLPQGVDSPNGYWSDVLFSVYISDAATATVGAIQFRNS